MQALDIVPMTGPQGQQVSQLQHQIAGIIRLLYYPPWAVKAVGLLT